MNDGEGGEEGEEEGEKKELWGEPVDGFAV